MGGRKKGPRNGRGVNLSPEEQAELRARTRQSKAARKGKRSTPRAQMSHACGKHKKARQDEQRLRRERGGGS